MSSISLGTHGHADSHGHAGRMSVGQFVSTYVFSRDHKIIGLQFQ